MARARDIQKKDYYVVAVIGDGALNGGLALEALNDVGFRKTNLIITGLSAYKAPIVPDFLNAHIVNNIVMSPQEYSLPVNYTPATCPSGWTLSNTIAISLSGLGSNVSGYTASDFGSGACSYFIKFVVFSGCVTTLFSLVVATSFSLEKLHFPKFWCGFIAVVLPSLASIFGFGRIVSFLYPLASVVGIFVFVGLVFSVQKSG